MPYRAFMDMRETDFTGPELDEIQEQMNQIKNQREFGSSVVKCLVPIADFLNHQESPFIAFDALSAATINGKGVQQSYFILVTNGTYKGLGSEVMISYNAHLKAPLAVLADYGFII